MDCRQRFRARIIAQTCHQSGLSVIYTDLLDFAGDEIYFFRHPALEGKTLRQCMFAFEHNAVMGICDGRNECHLNPPHDMVLSENDQLIVIAEDDDRIVMNTDPPPAIDERLIALREAARDAPERLLILGWNTLGPEIVSELACYMPQGSTVEIVSSAAVEVNAAGSCAAEEGRSGLNIHVTHGDTTDRRTLEALGLGAYDHIVVLCYDSLGSSQKADAKTLITLLHLRDIADKCGFGYTIVSQMMDVRNRNLQHSQEPMILSLVRG